MAVSEVKILHCLESFGGGTAKVVQALIDQIPDAQHIVVHGARANEINPMHLREEFAANVRFIHWRFTRRELNPVFDLLALLHLWLIFLTHHAHVYHLHSSKAGFLGRIAAFFSLKKRVIYTAHAASFLRKDVSSHKKSLFMLLERMAAIFPGKVVACSYSEQLAFEQIGIKAYCIPNGVTVSDYTKVQTASSHTITIVNSGRLTTQKNPALFNTIAEQLLSDKRFQFLWIGEGELAHQLKASNITLTGWQDRAQVNALLCKADVFLSTSLWEGLSIAILEAMDNCLPLLLHNCEGNADLVEVGKNGYLFEKTDQAIEHLKELANDSALRLKMGLFSKKMLKEQFSIEQFVQRYRALYGI